MPYRKPLHIKGAWEPPHLHYLKLCWFEVHFEDVTDEISRKYFVEHFFEIAESRSLYEKMEEIYGLKWEYFNDDGTPKKYNWEVLDKNSVFTRYQWKEQYPIFKTDKLQLTNDTARERVERSIDKDTVDDIIEYRWLTQKIKSLQESSDMRPDLDYSKTIQRYQRAKTIIADRISKRLGLDELNVNLDGKLDIDAIISEGTYSSDEIDEIQNVSSKPDDETQRFLDKL